MMTSIFNYLIVLQYHCHVLCLNGQHGPHLMLQESDLGIDT
jgi:hypothetical protein